MQESVQSTAKGNSMSPRRVAVDTSEAMSFEATEPGPYQMLVDSIEDPKKSKGGKGPNGMMVHFAFQDPAIAQECGSVQRWFALEGKGTGFTRELWKAATGEDLPKEAALDIDLDDAVGRPVLVDITNETYEGRLQNAANRITAVN